MGIVLGNMSMEVDMRKGYMIVWGWVNCIKCFRFFWIINFKSIRNIFFLMYFI